MSLRFLLQWIQFNYIIYCFQCKLEFLEKRQTVFTTIPISLFFYTIESLLYIVSLEQKQPREQTFLQNPMAMSPLRIHYVTIPQVKNAQRFVVYVGLHRIERFSFITLLFFLLNNILEMLLENKIIILMLKSILQLAQLATNLKFGILFNYTGNTSLSKRT